LSPLAYIYIYIYYFTSAVRYNIDYYNIVITGSNN